MALFASVRGAARRRAGEFPLFLSSRRSREIRSRIAAWEDPYLRPEEQPSRPSVCEACGAVYANHRWYAPEDSPLPAGAVGGLPRVVCPADRRSRQGLPAGVVTISGEFLEKHWPEVRDLILSEERHARADNPMERIISWRSGDGVVIETTNPRLAQRIGHRLTRSFRGRVSYHWAGDDHIVRVNWHRDA
jgi:hypothetical protein